MADVIDVKKRYLRNGSIYTGDTVTYSSNSNKSTLADYLVATGYAATIEEANRLLDQIIADNKGIKLDIADIQGYLDQTNEKIESVLPVYCTEDEYNRGLDSGTLDPNKLYYVFEE